jgi:hypothetical protein
MKNLYKLTSNIPLNSVNGGKAVSRKKYVPGKRKKLGNKFTMNIQRVRITM